MNTTNYLFVAGRSGGHIVPALTMAQRLKHDAQAKIIFVSTDTPLDHAIIEPHTWIDRWVRMNLGNVPRKIWYYPAFALLLLKTCSQMFTLLRTERPEKVYAFGGYPSIPVCVAAWVLRIPYELWELNVHPGAAVKLLAPHAQRVMICFDATRTYLPRAQCVNAHYPVRFTQVPTQREAREKLGIDPEKKVILVLGGSQGSHFMNTLALQLATAHPALFFMHQTGAQDLERVKRAYAEKQIQALVFDYRDDMAPCYAAADRVIARAGAGTLFELLFFKKQSTIIPLIAPSTEHQRDNALAMQHAHPELFTVVEQRELERADHKRLSFFDF